MVKNWEINGTEEISLVTPTPVLCNMAYFIALHCNKPSITLYTIVQKDKSTTFYFYGLA